MEHDLQIIDEYMEKCLIKLCKLRQERLKSKKEGFNPRRSISESILKQLELINKKALELFEE